jgi:predicted ATPase
VAGGYRFGHALYQQVLYRRVAAARRVRLHQRIGAREEVGYGAQAGARAAELAVHFEQGRDYPRAVEYLRQAAENAIQRSSHQEALTHLTQGLALLPLLPDTPERTQHELALQTSCGAAFMATRGYAAAEVEQTYARARTLCRQVGEGPQLFPVLSGLIPFYLVRAGCTIAQELAEQFLRLAQSLHDPARLLEAQTALGIIWLKRGEFSLARAHLEQGIALYDPQQHHALAFASMNPGVFCWGFVAHVLWFLGYPDQAVKASREALTLARELSHPYSLSCALHFAAWLHAYRREARRTLKLADASILLSTEQGFAFLMAAATILRGWALAVQGHGEEGMAQIRQGMTAYRATGAELEWPYWLALLAEAYGKAGQAEEGLGRLDEALTTVYHTGEHWWEAELHRLKGDLVLQQAIPYALQAEACFQQALDVACRQQAKSLELRSAMSLSRLWQHQGKHHKAHELLAPVYGWFTEGFDTVDLQEAKALLEELASHDTGGHVLKTSIGKVS